jgi:hypothetical protein
MQLGLVTAASQPLADDHDDESSEEPMEEWMDFEDLQVKDNGQPEQNGTENKGEYIFDARRRSSIDLNSLHDNFRDSMETINHPGDSSGSLTDLEPDMKRFRSKQPSISSIQELPEGVGEGGSDVDTVDGNDDVELHDA